MGATSSQRSTAREGQPHGLVVSRWLESALAVDRGLQGHHGPRSLERGRGEEGSLSLAQDRLVAGCEPTIAGRGQEHRSCAQCQRRASGWMPRCRGGSVSPARTRDSNPAGGSDGAGRRPAPRLRRCRADPRHHCAQRLPGPRSPTAARRAPPHAGACRTTYPTVALGQHAPSHHQVMSVQPSTTGSAATSVVEERQVDNQVGDHSSDCVDR